MACNVWSRLSFAKRRRVVRGLAAAQMLVLAMVVGCTPAPPPDGQLAIENVAKWYQMYRADHRGKPPVDENQFWEYVQKTLESRGTTLDRDQFFASPRDTQKYVIQYGQPTSPNPERNVAVCEKEGYGGKKWIAFESGFSQEVEDAELQSLMARP